MKRLETVFLKTHMTWKRVILLSVICGVAIGLLMIPKSLQGTSLQQPGISFEFWILFALYIILNSKTPLEAGLKTFAAFLISQPLIYLVQVPFSWMGWQLFGYYPRWGLLTLFTFPGGMLAWYTKKGNWWSVLILSVANALICFTLGDFIVSMLASFPKLLLANLFLLAELVIFTLLLLREKKKRIASFAIAAALLAGALLWQTPAAASRSSAVTFLDEGTAPYTVISESETFGVTIREDVLEVSYDPGEMDAEVHETIQYRDAEGNVFEQDVSFENGEVFFGED